MNPLLKKEIRLILPAFLAVLLLEVCQPWISHDHDTAISVAPVLFFFGIILLAVDSFGREFSLGTFTSLMAQPMERGQIWRTKIFVLLAAGLLIFGAYFASCEFRLYAAMVESQSVRVYNQSTIQGDFGRAMLASVAVLLIALTGGLWTALLLRQISAAFWITMLAPAGLAMGIIFAMSLLFKSAPDGALYLVLYSAAAIYVASTFWLAHRLFLRAEDSGWTGGVVAFSKWRYFEKTNQPVQSRRQSRALAALFKKELQLQSISLFGAATLLGLHLAVFILRGFYVPNHQNSLAEAASEFFWVLWLIIPLVIGCTAVAEERKLGVVAEQFCLPVSRRSQFWLKGVITLLLGVLLGGLTPLLLESLAMRLGIPTEIFKNTDYPWLILALAAGLAGIGFAASTLARNFLQALSIAIVMIVGVSLSITYLSAVVSQLGEYQQRFFLFGLIPDSWGLVVLLGLPTLIVAVPWLLYGNFNNYQEGGRLWRRNVVGVVAILAVILAGSATIYQRPWELWQPAEPAHGVPVLSQANPPELQTGNPLAMQVRLPDGRIWCGSLGYSFWAEQPSVANILWTLLVHPLPQITGPTVYIGGSNWVSATTWHVGFWDLKERNTRVNGYLDTIGIQTNGTLWISREARPVVWTGAEMSQFGDETNWHQVVRLQATAALLLKNDGSLWQWGTNRLDWNHWQTAWPTLRNLPMTRLGTNSDWQSIFSSGNWSCLQKSDGTLWSGNYRGKDGLVELTHPLPRPNLNPANSQNTSIYSEYQIASVRPDGTLWLDWRPVGTNGARPGDTGFVQVGQDSHWQLVRVMENCMVALKSDGSLWQWDLAAAKTPAAVQKTPPIRLGIHQDWLAMAGYWNGVITLAADGSLWLWPDRTEEAATFLRLPRQPEALGNIFAAK